MDLFGRPQDPTKIVVSTQTGDICLPILTSQSFGRRDNLTGRSMSSIGRVVSELLTTVNNWNVETTTFPRTQIYDDYIVFLRRARFKLEEVLKMQNRERQENDDAMAMMKIMTTITIPLRLLMQRIKTEKGHDHLQ